MACEMGLQRAAGKCGWLSLFLWPLRILDGVLMDHTRYMSDVERPVSTRPDCLCRHSTYVAMLAECHVPPSALSGAARAGVLLDISGPHAANAEDDMKSTPLHAAVQSGSLPLVRFLLDKGAAASAPATVPVPC